MNMTMKHVFRSLLILVLMAGLNNCKKDPGIGGDASIHGNVHARHYNSTFTTLISEYNAPDVYVYLIFGNDISYGKRIKTTYDGTFEFKYLYQGDYKIYVYSIDSAAVVNGEVRPDSAVIKNISISGRKERNDAGEFQIFK